MLLVGNDVKVIASVDSSTQLKARLVVPQDHGPWY